MNDERDDHAKGRHSRHPNPDGRPTPPPPQNPGQPGGQAGPPQRPAGGPPPPPPGGPAWPGEQPGGRPGAGGQQPPPPPGRPGGQQPQWPGAEAPEETTGAWTPSFDDDSAPGSSPSPLTSKLNGEDDATSYSPSPPPPPPGRPGQPPAGQQPPAGRPAPPPGEAPTQNLPQTPSADRGAAGAAGAAGAGGAAAGAAGAAAAGAAGAGAAAGAASAGAGVTREPNLLTHSDQATYNYYADDFDDDPYGDDDRFGDQQSGGAADVGSAGFPGRDDDEDPDDDMSAAQAKRAVLWRRIRRACYVGAAAAVIIPTLVFIYGYLFWEAPDEQKLLNMKQPITITYADDSPLATVSSDGSREVVRDLNQVSKPLRDATISAEDASFYTNPGFDFQGIARSVFFMFTGSGVGGGSTITQQFIKLDLELNKSDPDYVRKVKEIVLAFKITNERSKDDILLSYLNTAYYGRGANGITAAANAYFGKKPSEITPAEASVLAGMVQRPKGNDPREDLEQATTRFNYVLDQMVKNGFLPAGEREGLQLPETRGQNDWRIDRRLTPDQFKIKDQVLRELEEAGYDEDTLAREGFKIKTTIDPKAQKAAVEAATTQAENTLPDNIKTSLVAVEPKTGEVKAYYGGGGDVGGYDWAVAPTEPGSSFKPFAVLAGLHKGLGIGEFYDGSSPQTIAGTEFANAPNVACDVPTHCGVREAMTKSVNTVFVNMASRLGPPAIADAAHAAGVPGEYKSGKGSTKTLQNADGQTQSGIALGMYPVKPIDMANAYATLANQGKSHTPHLVREITPREGPAIKIHNEPVKTLYDESESEAAKLAYNTIASMFDVADHAKRGLEGDRPVMSKTGTHQYLDTKDNATAWMIGATPQLSTSVSMLASENGRNVPLEDNSGTSFYGGKYPAMVWQQFMNSYHKGLKVEQFKKTDTIGQFQDIPLPPPPTSSEPPSTSAPPPTMPSDSQDQDPTTSRERPGQGEDCGGFFQPPCESETSSPGETGDVAPTRRFGE